MLIDDNSYYIKQTNENFPQDGRIFVLPDYKYSHGLQDPNVYHVKTTVTVGYCLGAGRAISCRSVQNRPGG